MSFYQFLILISNDLVSYYITLLLLLSDTPRNLNQGIRWPPTLVFILLLHWLNELKGSFFGLLAFRFDIIVAINIFENFIWFFGFSIDFQSTVVYMI